MRSVVYSSWLDEYVRNNQSICLKNSVTSYNKYRQIAT